MPDTQDASTDFSMRTRRTDRSLPRSVRRHERSRAANDLVVEVHRKQPATRPGDARQTPVAVEKPIWIWRQPQLAGITNPSGRGRASEKRNTDDPERHRVRGRSHHSNTGRCGRGEDRRSDIDLWVLTRSGRDRSQREANAIARDLEDTAFDGDRYAYDIDVEAVQAIPAYTEDIRRSSFQGFRSSKRVTSKSSRTSSWRKELLMNSDVSTATVPV